MLVSRSEMATSLVRGNHLRLRRWHGRGLPIVDDLHGGADRNLVEDEERAFQRHPDAAVGGRVTGELAFVLPPGITVFSCQGYSTPVAVRARSWGRVKTLYR